jgi:hypothetical protein
MAVPVPKGGDWTAEHFFHRWESQDRNESRVESGRIGLCSLDWARLISLPPETLRDRLDAKLAYQESSAPVLDRAINIAPMLNHDWTRNQKYS